MASTADGVPVHELPAFELRWRFDDEDAPTEVTVFSPADGADVTTAWLTMDVDHAVRVDEIQ